MRYLLLLLLLAIGILALVDGFGDRESPADAPARSGQAEVRPTEAEEREVGAAEALDAIAQPRSSDALARALAAVLGDLVQGRLVADDRDRVEARILEALEAEKLADEVTLGSAARSATDKILEEMRKARGQGAAALPEAQSAQVVQAIAGQLAGRLRRALAVQDRGGVHEGSFLSVGLDYEAPAGHAKVDWNLIGGFDYREGMELPAAVAALRGQKVAIAGYMMAIGEFEDIHEFALVESQWSCCFGMPPNLNQIITVTIPDRDDGIELVAQPILVYGSFAAGEEREDDWVINVYRMTATGVELLDAQ
ncbi:MAG: DUF3299 domain-containing protein [Planctomycetes bacterium]|nr:DUF3299 domain-containing protein [Planctomycetota bacterium]